MTGSKYEDMELPPCFNFKVHRLMCLELRRSIDRVASMFSAIESARPGSSAAIQALCLLHDAIARANMLIQECSESSLLYLAVMGDRILSRCKKLREKFLSCLSRVQTMVPPRLAAEISKIMDELRDVKFFIESTEHYAAQAILVLLRRGTTSLDPKENLEFSMLSTACGALSISTPWSLLIEKRCIKRLLVKLRGRESVNKKILSYLLYLLRKYGKSVVEAERLANPRKEIGLDEFVSSVSVDTESLAESLDEISSQLLPLDDKDFIELYRSTESYNTELAFLSKLSLLPWRLQCEVVEDMKERLIGSDNIVAKMMLSRSQIESLARFLRDAAKLSDVKAREDGVGVLVSVLNMNRSETLSMLGDVANTITALFHDPGATTTKSLELLDILSCRDHFKSIDVVSGILPFILKALETRVREHEVLSLRILQNLSSCCEIMPHLVYLGCIPQLVRFLADPELGKHSIGIIRSLCNTEEGKAAVHQSIMTDSSVIRSLTRAATKESRRSGRTVIAEELCRVLAQEADYSSVSGTSDLDSGTGRKKVSAKLFRMLRRKVVVLSKLPSRLIPKVRTKVNK